ncbi:hypothetical protein Pcac1_g15735 [Phytophthora cactorum]|nr:hypothetical protein Pcac1_g15735 [Phytophthora cactorum]
MLFENPSGARTVRGIMTQVQASCEFHISYGHSTEQGRTRQTSSVSRDGRTLAKLVLTFRNRVTNPLQGSMALNVIEWHTVQNVGDVVHRRLIPCLVLQKPPFVPC